jgi:hypothetical protein
MPNISVIAVTIIFAGFEAGSQLGKAVMRRLEVGEATGPLNRKSYISNKPRAGY